MATLSNATSNPKKVATPTNTLTPAPMSAMGTPRTVAPTSALASAPVGNSPVYSAMSGGGIDANTMNLIRQKALSGQQMSSPTAEKNALYEYYKANPNAQSTGALTPGMMQAINSKAQLGQMMDSPTGEKDALYKFFQQNGVNPSVKDTNLTTFNNNQNQYNNSVNQANQNYQNSQASQNANKWNNATISDIAAKYGFDYSRDYAKQQAEAEAQALRNANADAQRRNESNKNTGLQSIDNELMNQAEGLDRNYFQQYIAQQQNQVNSGLNSGIASDQDLRLQMNRQAEMGDSYRDASLGKMKINENFSLEDIRLAESMGLINQQALAREDSLFNERLQQGFGNLMTEREMANALDQQQWGRSQADMDRAMQLLGMNNSQEQWLQGFNYDKGRDLVGDNQWQKQFDYTAGRDKIGDQQWQSQFDWTKQQDTIGNQQWEKQFNEDVRQFGLEYALQKQSLNASRTSGGGGSRSSGGSSGGGGSVSPPAQQLASQFKNFQNAASKQVDTFEDSYYQPKINAINKLVSPMNKTAYQKAIANIKAPTYYDRALSLFK